MKKLEINVIAVGQRFNNENQVGFVSSYGWSYYDHRFQESVLLDVHSPQVNPQTQWNLTLNPNSIFFLSGEKVTSWF